MRLQCTKSELMRCVKAVLKAVSPNSPKIRFCGYNLLLIRVDNAENFTVTGSCPEFSIEAHGKIIEGDEIETGSFAIDAKVFANINKKLPNGILSICADGDQKVTISDGQSKFGLTGEKSSRFPEVYKVAEGSKHVIPAPLLRDMIKQTVYAAAHDDLKPIMKGELVDITDSEFRIVALDGFRIALSATPRIEEEPIESGIVPAKATSALSSILVSVKEESVSVYFDKNHICFEVAEYKVVSKLIDGDFINYGNVFGINTQITAKVNREQLLNSVEKARVLCDHAFKPDFGLSVDDDKIVITCSGNVIKQHVIEENAVESREEIEAELEGGSIKMLFNPQYLVDTLNAIDDDEVIMSFGYEPARVMVITGNTNKLSKHLVLPLRKRIETSDSQGKIKNKSEVLK